MWIWLGIILIYLIGTVIVGRIVYIACEDHGFLDGDGEFTGMLLGVLWPLVLPVGLTILLPGWLLYKAISRPTPRERQRERAASNALALRTQVAEAQQTEQLAERYGLWMGTTPERRPW